MYTALCNPNVFINSVPHTFFVYQEICTLLERHGVPIRRQVDAAINATNTTTSNSSNAVTSADEILSQEFSNFFNATVDITDR